MAETPNYGLYVTEPSNTDTNLIDWVQQVNGTDSTSNMMKLDRALADIETNKQNKLTFDSEPTEGSSNPVTSDGIKKSLDGMAKLTIDGTVTSGNIGYAEIGEWTDGNADNEDRIGYFVAIDMNSEGATMVKAMSIDDVRGVTVAAPAFSGNCAEAKYDAETGALLKQYDYVAVMGLVSIIDNGTCTVNGRCMPSDDGTAVPSTNNLGYHVIDRIDETHILIDLEPGADMVKRIKDDVFALQRECVLFTEGRITLPDWLSWHPVSYGSGKFVTMAYGSDVAAYSTDGVNWAQVALPSSQKWQAVVYGDGKFVSVAEYSDIAVYSTDGINWEQTTMPTYEMWIAVTYGEGKFVAIATNSSVVAYSADGINWTLSTMPSSEWWVDVTYGEGKFVAITGLNDIAAYSTDGINWEQTTTTIAPHWRRVAYGDGKFVAIAPNNAIAAYSTDGIHWTQTTLWKPNGTLSADIEWEDVTYGNGKFVAISFLSDQDCPVAYSTDGINWYHSVPTSLQTNNGADVTDDVKRILGVGSTSDYSTQTNLDTHIADTTVHITSSERATWNNKAPKPTITTITLTSSGWNSTSKTQTVMVSGVLSDETAQLIQPIPALSSQAAYYEAGILCTAQAENSLTFTANSIPTDDLTVYVTIQEVSV